MVALGAKRVAGNGVDKCGQAADMLIGSYGTDMHDWLQLPYLESFLSDLENLLVCEARGLGNDATFGDIFLERSTRTRDLGWLESSCYREWIDQILRHDSYCNEYPSVSGSWNKSQFMRQKIKAWVAELRQEITGEPNGYVDVYTEETWT